MDIKTESGSYDITETEYTHDDKTTTGIGLNDAVFFLRVFVSM